MYEENVLTKNDIEDLFSDYDNKIEDNMELLLQNVDLLPLETRIKLISELPLTKISKMRYYNGKVLCKICNEWYDSNNGYGHNRTKSHRLYSDLNSKVMKLLLGQT